jgi:D-alanyl-D-alanine carboxypeptidase (penicillin-binding protein 5/6)
MPQSPRASWVSRKLPALWLCAAMALCAAPGAFAAPTPQPTRMPEPTRDPNAETYDDTRPELLAPDQLIAASAILIEASSGEVVFEKNADEIMYPASTTKIMTALIAIQKMEHDVLPEDVTISANAANQPGDASLVPVSQGEVVKMEDLIVAMLLRSGNDAAVALAEHVGGSESAFVDMMNDYALFLGCKNTHFANPHGYHDPDHYTTARDMAMIARAAMDVETFREAVSTVEYKMPITDFHPTRNLTTNDLFINGLDEKNRYYFPEAIGVKTGYHSEAQSCFVGAALRDGVELISVVLYSSDKGRYEDTRRLMEYGFKQFESTTPMEIYSESPRILNVAGFDLSDAKDLGQLTLGIRPLEEGRDVHIVGRKEEIETIKRDFSRLTQVVMTRSDRAPIAEGEVMGLLTYFPRDGGPVEYELYATRSLAAR